MSNCKKNDLEPESVKNKYEYSKYNDQHKQKCLNCGAYGHMKNACSQPITSFGIIALQLVNDDNDKLRNIICDHLSKIEHINPSENIELNNEDSIRIVSEIQEKLRFVMITQKHSIAYMDLICGKYNDTNLEQISFIISEMSRSEINRIIEHMTDFNYLWNDVWSMNRDKPSDGTFYGFRSQKSFERERKIAGDKYEHIRTSTIIKLSDIIKHTKLSHENPEWGFPKGRRNSPIESNIECSKREFTEETGLDGSTYDVFENINQQFEKFNGSDGRSYMHKYYISMLKKNIIPIYDQNIDSQWFEIGDIGMFNINDSKQKIFDRHITRRNIMSYIFTEIVQCVINANK